MKQGSGRVLFYLGLAGLFLSLGSVAGYYFSDVGTPWLPTMLSGIVAASVVSLCLLLLGNLLQGKFLAAEDSGRRVRRRVWVITCLLLLGGAIHMTVTWLQRESPLTDLDRQEFNRAYSLDCDRYQAYRSSMHGILSQLEARQELFAEERVLTPEEEEWLAGAFGALYHTLFAQDRIRQFHEDYYRFDPSRRQRSYHLRSYLLTFAAELELVHAAARLDELLDENPRAASFLNSPRPAMGLPADSLQRVFTELLGSRDQARVKAGSFYLGWLDRGLNAHMDAQDMGLEWLWQDIRRSQAALDRYPLFSGMDHTAGSDVLVLKKQVRRAWFPAQKGTAKWMGNTKLRRAGRYLIGDEQRQIVVHKLQAGDIILSRKNWFMSNVGLPGFWPHAVLYLGEKEDLENHLDTPEVRAWIAGQGGVGQDPAEFLAARFPGAWERWPDQGAAVIEAVSPGVVLRPLHEATGDYLAALRPNLTPLRKFQALLTAFSHLDKPYDYNFDFTTDHALVCTELVWRSYRPGADGNGLEPPLTPIAGRLALPANDLARWFRDTREGDEQPLAFVMFLDASEERGISFAADEEAFLGSIDRTKWEFGLE